MRFRLAVALLLLSFSVSLSGEKLSWEGKSPQFVALSVGDIDSMAAWYETMFDLEPGTVNELQDGAVRQTSLRNEHLIIELVQHDQAASRASHDIARSYFIHGIFKVGFFVEDIEHAIATLEKRGATFRGRLMEIREHGVRTILVEDPEGNTVQLFEAIAPEQ